MISFPKGIPLSKPLELVLETIAGDNSEVHGTSRKGIMRFLEFRMEVAQTFLAQHNNVPEDSTDLSKQENNTDRSVPEKKTSCEGSAPHLRPQKGTTSFTGGQPEERSALQSDKLSWENLNLVCNMQGVCVLGSCTRPLHSLSQRSSVINCSLRQKGQYSCALLKELRVQRY